MYVGACGFRGGVHRFGDSIAFKGFSALGLRA